MQADTACLLLALPDHVGERHLEGSTYLLRSRPRDCALLAFSSSLPALDAGLGPTTFDSADALESCCSITMDKHASSSRL